MADFSIKILSTVRELANLVSINKDVAGEFLKTRHNIRMDAINKIEDILKELKKVTDTVESIYEKASKEHEVINKQAIEWIAKKPAKLLHRETIGGIDIIARSVDFLEEVGPDLCFMPAINRFAVRFAGILIVGNIGNIYSNCLNPEKVKECKFSSIDYLPSTNKMNYRMPKCSKNDGECSFYHNPLIYPSSKEPRNFFSTSGYYVNADSTDGKNPNYLRFGSRNSLREDINRISDEEARRFEDFVSHMIICLIILKKRGGI
jgi:hypothetical protein